MVPPCPLNFLCSSLFAGLWIREASYIEQPDVHFKNQYLAVIATSQDGDYVAWSTYTNYRQLEMENQRYMSIKVRKVAGRENRKTKVKACMCTDCTDS